MVAFRMVWILAKQQKGLREVNFDAG